MNERPLARLERYARNPNTRVARAINHAFPKTGIDYEESKGRVVFERTVATGASIATLPLAVAIAAAIKLEDGGKVFYKHKRVGKHGKSRYLWKFRTLKKGADCDKAANEANVKANGRHADPRNTCVGEVLRETKLDELPQIWQVALGQLRFNGIRAMDKLTLDVMAAEHLPETVVFKKDVVDKNTPAVFNLDFVLGWSTKNATKTRLRINTRYSKIQSFGVDLYLQTRFLQSYIGKNKENRHAEKRKRPVRMEVIFSKRVRKREAVQTNT